MTYIMKNVLTLLWISIQKKYKLHCVITATHRQLLTVQYDLPSCYVPYLPDYCSKYCVCVYAYTCIWYYLPFC